MTFFVSSGTFYTFAVGSSADASGQRAGSFSEDRPLGWDPIAEGNRAGDGMACNSSDRRLRRKQGTAVGAAASKMRAAAKQLLGAATRISCLRRKLPTHRPYKLVRLLVF